MDSKEQAKKTKLQKRFGSHLKQLRQAKGITPAELARRCFMERSNIARLEGGRENPSLYTIKRLCEALEVSYEEFFKDFETSKGKS